MKGKTVGKIVMKFKESVHIAVQWDFAVERTTTSTPMVATVLLEVKKGINAFSLQVTIPYIGVCKTLCFGKYNQFV